MSTCGECEHFEGCLRFAGHVTPDRSRPECPARTSERELLMVLEAAGKAFDAIWTACVNEELGKVIDIANKASKAIQKAKGK